MKLSAAKKLLGLARRLTANATSHEVKSVQNEVSKALFLAGQSAAQSMRNLDRLPLLADAAFQVTSQWGEDGIIEWLVSALNTGANTFVEFGVEDFREANCRFLMENRNWRGLVFDGDPENITKLKSEGNFWRYDLVAESHFITAENIDSLIVQAGFSGEIGLLSVDIDGVDYWVFKAIESVSPEILILEYNSVFGDTMAVTVPYRRDFIRYKAHHSGLYYGASLRAMRMLAEQKGYTFIGTPRTGTNAFFVRNDLAELVLSKLQRVAAFPSLHRESRNENGDLTFARGRSRFELVSGMPVIDLSVSSEITFDDYKRFYSEEWLGLLD